MCPALPAFATFFQPSQSVHHTHLSPHPRPTPLDVAPSRALQNDDVHAAGVVPAAGGLLWAVFGLPLDYSLTAVGRRLDCSGWPAPFI
jgi:hypothetical protein